VKKIIEEAYFWLPDEGYVYIYKMEHLYTEKLTMNIVKSTGIGLYLPFFEPNGIPFGLKSIGKW